MRSIPQYLLKTNPAKPIIQYQFWFWCMSSSVQTIEELRLFSGMVLRSRVPIQMLIEPR